MVKPSVKPSENQLTEKGRQGKKLQGLRLSLVVMTVSAFVIVGLFISLCVSKILKNVIINGIEQDLKHIAMIADYALDTAYEGDWQYVGNENVAIVKGTKVINGNYTLIDSIKEDTGAEVSVLYGNTRIITTIEDSDGERIVGSVISDKIVDKVIKTGKGVFYDNAMVNKTAYCGYYMPLTNSDGEVVGMIGVLKPLDAVNRRIHQEMGTLMLVLFFGLTVMALISFYHANHLIVRIHKIQDFIVKIANEDFRVRLEEKVFDKKDEISDIARSAEKMQNSLRKLIELDMLTEINNRRSGDKMLEETRERFEKQGEKFAVALADIDFFKKVNDTYGHQCGDMVLKEVASILRKNMLGKGFVARWGGEEFLLVFEDMQVEKACEAMQKIVEEIRHKKMVYQEQTFSVTLTCGIVEGRNEQGNLLVKEADDKLYYGKQNGRDRIVV